MHVPLSFHSNSPTSIGLLQFRQKSAEGLFVGRYVPLGQGRQEAELVEFAGLIVPVGHAAMAVSPVQYELVGQAIVSPVSGRQ